MALIAIKIDKYNNCKTNYYEFIIEFLNNFNLNENSSATTLNVMCTNIRNVNASFDECILLLENDINYNKIGIYILTETWNNIGDCEYSISGYNTYFSSKKRNQNDRIIIFVKKYLRGSLHKYGFDKCNILRLTVNKGSKPLMY